MPLCSLGTQLLCCHVWFCGLGSMGYYVHPWEQGERILAPQGDWQGQLFDSTHSEQSSKSSTGAIVQLSWFDFPGILDKCCVRDAVELQAFRTHLVVKCLAGHSSEKKRRKIWSWCLKLIFAVGRTGLHSSFPHGSGSCIMDSLGKANSIWLGNLSCLARFSVCL